MPAPRQQAGGSCPSSVVVIDYRSHPSGALKGFVTVETPSGFTISGIAVFSQAGSRWCGLPQKPRLSNGKAVRSKEGGLVCDPIIEIRDRTRKEAFDAAVLDALDRYREERGS